MRTLLLLSVLLAAGCTSREITFGGATYKSWRFGNKETIGGIEIVAPDGTKFIVKTYQSDQVTAMGVVTEAAVSAAIKGVKP